ncbi:MAG: redoxin domain-containing protein [Psychroserpens sp.]|nr:redoxin domain-containing protein [Psychroserpens sp.]
MKGLFLFGNKTAYGRLMRFNAFFICLFVIIVSCKNDPSVDLDAAYFGGEIINPSNNYLTLSSQTGERDTIYLNENNRFLFKVDSVIPGLYSFAHGGEYQNILLEPQDSLWFRLNTNDFDESLVYTGVGSKKNNYFIKAFLDDEIESREFMNTSHLEPEEFMEHMNSLREQKIAYLDEFLGKKPCSELFETIARSRIDYNHYTYHEMFPFGYYGNEQLIHFKDLPEKFYDFRNEVDLNNENLKELYVYNRFLFWHFNNLALKKFYSNGSHATFDRMSLDYNIEKLRLIDSTISSEVIKNYLLKHIIRDFVLNSQDKEATLEMINTYLSKSSNDDDKVYLKNLVERANKLSPGNILADATIVDVDGNEMQLSALADKPTIIYCWSSNYKLHSRNSHFKMKELKTKFPNVNWIAINFNDNDHNFWKRSLRSLKYPIDNEYKFVNPSQALENYVITFTHRIFLIDENMEIIDSNVSLFSDKILTDLSRLSSNSYK